MRVYWYENDKVTMQKYFKWVAVLRPSNIEHAVHVFNKGEL